MLKVVLVDDEPMVKEGMKKLLHSTRRWQVVGEANNGKQAIQQIKQLKPDIVISDIRMPEMDGLELLRQVSDLEFNPLIILLTGYPEFDYAQQAVRFGAFDYIVKPCRAQEIMIVLNKAEQTIIRRKNEQKLVADYESKLTAYEELVVEKLVRDMLQGEEIDKDMLADLPFLQYIRKMTVIAWSSNNFAMPKDYILRLLRAPGDTSGLLTYHERNDNWIIVIGWNDNITETHRLERLKRAFALLHDQLGNIGHDWRIGISETCPVADSSKLYDQSKLALNRTTSLKPILFYSELSNEPLPNGIIPLELQFSLLKAVKKADKREARELFGQIKLILDQFNLSMVSNHAHQLHEQLAASVMNQYFTNETILFDSKTISQKFHSKREAVEWLEQKIEGYIEQIESSEQRQIDHVVRRVLKILHEKYNKDIKLGECASEIGISPSYLSTLFKQQVGMPFSDYLSQIRIQKAKTMLLKGNFKVYQVAQELGYVDGRHFSQIFKKVTGVTPIEYSRFHGIASNDD